MKSKSKQLERKLNIKDKEDILTTKEKLKQKIQAKAQRMRRYEITKTFFRQNMIFKENGKKFYRELSKKKIEANELPTIEEVQEFWSTIWEDEKMDNEETHWIQEQQDRYKGIESQE